MTTPQGPADKLVSWLETLPAEERREITAFLLGRSRPVAPSTLGLTLPHMMISRIGERPPAEEERARRLAAVLPAGEDSQLVTIRLPADRHAQLRTWCGENGFTMAAVVRGLVERFLEERAPGTGTA
jgi:hypothetical protein